MKKEFTSASLDVIGFAEAAARLTAAEPVSRYTRLSAELAETDTAADPLVEWEATGENRPGADGGPVAWLHLDATATVPLTCQRCLSPVATELRVDRWFRFAADETIAAAEDETSDEDVLVASRDFDLQALVEDELLMEIPVTPRHDVCPEPVRLSAVDPDFEEAQESKPNPFAALGALRPRKPD